MTNKKRTLFIIVLLAAVIASTFWPDASPADESPERTLNDGAASAENFAKAVPGREFVFPADFGPHPEYLTEWWYYTGNLDSADGQHFGYQLTFFRRALVPADQHVPRDSDWAAEQIYFAHFALTDVAAENFYAYERFSRGAVGLAGAQAAPYEVWLEDWQVIETGQDEYRLHSSQGEIEINLDMTNTQGQLLQGEGGFSPKGPEPGNASYYYSQTRLASSGTITVADTTHEVTG
ncbi:MAG: carotenoid 1,2-hydratase, partial [Chloroflexota bacterium]